MSREGAETLSAGPWWVGTWSVCKGPRTVLDGLAQPFRGPELTASEQCLSLPVPPLPGPVVMYKEMIVSLST